MSHAKSRLGNMHYLLPCRWLHWVIRTQPGTTSRSCDYSRMQLLQEPWKSRNAVRGINVSTFPSSCPLISCKCLPSAKANNSGIPGDTTLKVCPPGLRERRKWWSMNLWHSKFTQLEWRKARNRRQVHDALVTAFTYSSTIHIVGTW